MALPKNWVRFNSVGRRVDPKIVEEHGGVSGRRYRVAMKVLGMGDTNASCIAQAVHEHVLSSKGLLQPHTKVVYGKPVPREPLLEGAYLDDLLVVHRKKLDSPILPLSLRCLEGMTWTWWPRLARSEPMRLLSWRERFANRSGAKPSFKLGRHQWMECKGQ